MSRKKQPEIRNKEVRTKMFLKLQKEKLKAKRKTKIENKDKPKQMPKTIENCRVKDETFINDFQNDEELKLDLNTDELSNHLKIKTKDLQIKELSDETLEFQKSDKNEESDDENCGKNNYDPKILITTNDLKISFKTYKICREISRILPNANYFYRKNIRLSKVIPEAIKRDYSAIIVLNEDNKEPNALTISILPEGPTMNFKLSNLKLSDEIKGGGNFTKHKPEIILNNFNSRLGIQIGRSFAALFPNHPQYEGRHCITFHNQRDFIFFRHHRYIFKNSQKVGLQELGPRFTLKLRSLQKGILNKKYGEYEWINKRHDMESNRRQFHL